MPRRSATASPTGATQPAAPAATKASTGATLTRYAPEDLKPGTSRTPVKGQVAACRCPNCAHLFEIGPFAETPDVERATYRCPSCAKDFALKRFISAEIRPVLFTGPMQTCEKLISLDPLEKCGEKFQPFIGGDPKTGRGGRPRSGCPKCGAQLPADLNAAAVGVRVAREQEFEAHQLPE